MLDLEAKARRLRAQELKASASDGLGVVVIDYIQLVARSHLQGANQQGAQISR